MKKSESMSAQQFWAAFRALFCADSETRAEAQRAWKGKYTAFIKEQVCRILSDFGYERENMTEQYLIDYVGWRQRKGEVSPLVSESGRQQYRPEPCLWQLDVAVEHENDEKKWTEELVKLAFIRCPLRVVIGYAPAFVLEDENERRKHLAFAAQLLRALEQRAPVVADGEEYLLILGKSRIAADRLGPDTYQAFCYRDGTFVPIGEEK